MTLVLAIGCTDGLVLAADSASSDPTIGLKQTGHNKIKQLPQAPIIYGGSGDVGLLQKIHESLLPLTPKPTIKRLRQEIKKAVIPDIAEAVQLHVRTPAPGLQQPPMAILLFGGVHEGRPWILEIEQDGRDTLYGEDYGSFCAIGSGKPWAQALFRPHLDKPRDVRLGRIFAYRLIKDAIDLAAHGLSEPIHIYTMSLTGQVTLADGPAMREIAHAAQLWRELERDSVGSLLAKLDGHRPAQTETPPEIPKPE